MLFNSIEFAIFLPIVFLLYWSVANKSFKQQNILLLISSYLLSKSALLGVAHPLLGLSEIGANVPRPPGL